MVLSPNPPIAQLVEQLALNEKVQGSIPCGRKSDKVWKRAGGEIGRRTALRTRRRKAWEFESPPAHKDYCPSVSLNGFPV